MKKDLVLIEVERHNAIYKYSQLENMTDDEVDKAIGRGFLSFVLNGVKNENEDCRYSINIDKGTNEVIVCDNLKHEIIARGVENARKFMIENDYGVIANIIELEK